MRIYMLISMLKRNSFENSAAKIIRLRLGSQQARAPIEESMNRTSFQDSRLVRREINQYTPEDFKLAFDEVAVNSVIQLNDIVGIVRSVMGADAPLWIVNKFTSFGRQIARYKAVTWHQFRYPMCCHTVFFCLHILNSITCTSPVISLCKSKKLWIMNHRKVGRISLNGFMEGPRRLLALWRTGTKVHTWLISAKICSLISTT